MVRSSWRGSSIGPSCRFRRCGSSSEPGRFGAGRRLALHQACARGRRDRPRSLLTGGYDAPDPPAVALVWRVRRRWVALSAGAHPPPSIPAPPRTQAWATGYTGEDGRASPSARSPKPGAMIAPGWADELLGDERLGREHQRGDRRGVLDRQPGDAERVDDAVGEQVAELAGERVQAVAGGHRRGPGRSTACAVVAGVGRDPEQRLGEHVADDLDAAQVVALEPGVVERRARRAAAPSRRPATMPSDDRRAGRRQRALGAPELLLELRSGGRADVDDGEPAGELGEPLAQRPRCRSPAVARSSSTRICARRAATRVRGAGALDEHRRVLGDDDAAGAARTSTARPARASARPRR